MSRTGLVATLSSFLELSLRELLPDALGVELDEFEDAELLRSPFIIEGAGVADLALEQSQVFRIDREFQAGVRRVRRRVNRAMGVVWALVYEEGALKLDFATESATVAFAALIGLISIDQVVGKHIRQDVPAQRPPGVK